MEILQIRALYNGKEIIGKAEEIRNSTFEYAKQESKSVQDKLEALNKNWDEIKKNIDGVNEKSITMFSIFSAVIIAFTGGFSFLSEALQGFVAPISKYRLFFVVLAIGFVLYNVIISLLFIIGRFNHSDLSHKCRYGECNSCYRTHDLGGVALYFCRVLHRYSYAFLVNISLLYFLYMDGILWLFSSGNRDVFLMFFRALDLWHPVALCLFEGLLVLLPLFLFVVLLMRVFLSSPEDRRRRKLRKLERKGIQKD